MVLERRSVRYEEEKFLYEKYVINPKKEFATFQMVVKDNSLKSCYSKPFERRFDD
jgi:hypothetical protein